MFVCFLVLFWGRLFSCVDCIQCKRCYECEINGAQFCLEDGDSMFLRNVGIQVPDCTASYPRRTQCGYSASWKPQIVSYVRYYTGGTGKEQANPARLADFLTETQNGNFKQLGSQRCDVWFSLGQYLTLNTFSSDTTFKKLKNTNEF
jgi:hypothetical protein